MTISYVMSPSTTTDKDTQKSEDGLPFLINRHSDWSLGIQDLNPLASQFSPGANSEFRWPVKTEARILKYLSCHLGNPPPYDTLAFFEISLLFFNTSVLIKELQGRGGGKIMVSALPHSRRLYRKRNIGQPVKWNPHWPWPWDRSGFYTVQTPCSRGLGSRQMQTVPKTKC